MKLFAIISLSLLLLVQPLSKMLVLAEYQVNKNYIASVLCINKNKPALHCEGKCFLSRQLAKTNQTENKIPDFFKLKAEVPFLNQLVNPAFLPVTNVVKVAFLPYLLKPLKLLEYAIFHPPRFF